MSETNSELIFGELTSDLVPSPVVYAALLPPEELRGDGDLPLYLLLHGRGGSRDSVVERARPLIESLWADGTLVPCAFPTEADDPDRWRGEFAPRR